MLAGLKRTHVQLIASYSVRFALRTGGGLVSLLVVLTTGLVIAQSFFAPVEMLMQQSPAEGHTQEEAASTIDRISRSDQFAGVVESVTGAKTEEVQYLLNQKPALLSAIWIIMLMVFPFIACIVGFNQTSGDIGSRGLRYVLLRTERPNIFLGRFFGSLVFAALSTIILVVIFLLYVGLKLNIYPLGDMLGWGLQGYVAILVLMIPYLAMCAWLSSLIDSAFGSLSICLLATGAPIILIKTTIATSGGRFDGAGRLLPWGWKYELLSGDPATRALAYGAMAGFTLLFLFLGLRHFSRRDL